MVGELLKQEKPEIGYDAQNGQYVDMFKAGIIDPTKVRRRSRTCAQGLLWQTAEGSWCGGRAARH